MTVGPFGKLDPPRGLRRRATAPEVWVQPRRSRHQMTDGVATGSVKGKQVEMYRPHTKPAKLYDIHHAGHEPQQPELSPSRGPRRCQKERNALFEVPQAFHRGAAQPTRRSSDAPRKVGHWDEVGWDFSMFMRNPSSATRRHISARAASVIDLRSTRRRGR